MAIEYASLRGSADGMDFSVITEIARYFEDHLHYEIPPRTPFVGRDFNVTRAGIHADGLLKDEEIYNIFNTEKILNRPAAVAVDAHSGLAGIAHWITRFFRLDDRGITVDKRAPFVVAMKEQIDALYAGGRTTVMGDLELEHMLLDADPEAYERFTRMR